MNDNLCIIEALNKNHIKDDFNSGSEELDIYIKRQAGQDVKKHIAATFILHQQTSKYVLGYYTLSSIGIYGEDFPENIIKKLPKYPMLPATLLGRLAVHHQHRGKRFGELLLMDAMQRSLNQSYSIGSMALVVEAKDKSAVEFYQRYGFLLFPSHPKKLFLVMETIKKLF